MIGIFIFSSQVLSNCQETPFCRRNINRAQSKWSLSPTNTWFSNNIFKGNILLDGEDTEYKLIVSKIRHSGFRIFIDLGEKKSRNRFKITENSIFIHNERLNSYDTLRYDYDKDSVVLSDDVVKIIVNRNPMVIKFYHNNKEVLSINEEQLLLIEDDTKENEETTVGVDFSFPEESEISGLAGGHHSLNIQDTIAEPIRAYHQNLYGQYGSLPLIVSHSKCEYNPAVLIINPTDSFYNIKSLNHKKSITTTHEGGFVDLIVFIEKLENVTAQYTYLTGIPKMPPAFSFGLHYSNESCVFQNLIEETIGKFNYDRIPFDAIWLGKSYLKNGETFNENKEIFPQLDDISFNLSKQGRCILKETSSFVPLDAESDAYDKNLLIHENTSKIAEITSEKRSGYFIDFFNHAAKKWWSEKITTKFGNHSFTFHDSDEPTTDESSCKTINKSWILGGFLDREVHNLYGSMMTSATYNGLIQRNENQRPFIVTRSYFAGTQKYAWHWTGPSKPSWEHFAYSIDQSLTASISGYPFMGSSIYAGTDSDLMRRWYQAAIFTQPLIRLHTTKSEENTANFDAIKNILNYRYKIFGVWYTAAHEYVSNGRPPVVPMWAEFPLEEEMHHVRFQALLGGALMVAPCVRSDANDVNIVKPPGEWFNLNTGEKLKGGRNPIDKSEDDPLAFIRGGRIVPLFFPSSSVASTVKNGNITLVAAFKDGEAIGKLYLDDMTTLDYEKGESVTVLFRINNDSFEIAVEGKPKFAQGYISTIKLFGVKPEDMRISFPKGRVIINKTNEIIVSNLKIPINKELKLINFIQEKNNNMVASLIVIPIAIAIVGCGIFACSLFGVHTQRQDEISLLSNKAKLGDVDVDSSDQASEEMAEENHENEDVEEPNKAPVV